MIKISDKGRALIKSFEGLRLTAYLPTPNDKPTIGWGHVGKDVHPGLTITVARAEELLDLDLAAVELCLGKYLLRALNQNQQDALIALVFNVGCTAFARSYLLRNINSGDDFAARKNWLDWDHLHGVELPGLKKRREAEWALFSAPTDPVGDPPRVIT